MSHTDAFIHRIESLQEGERSRLRRLAGQPLDATLSGFDLFTGLWWPLRQESPVAPRRETSWLVAKLFGAYPVPHKRPEDPSARPNLERVLGRAEPRDPFGRERFRRRFDALLQSPLPNLEPHLHWALSAVSDEVDAGRTIGLDWVQLLDDVSIWDRGAAHRRDRDVRDVWAEAYLNAVPTIHQGG